MRYFELSEAPKLHHNTIHAILDDMFHYINGHYTGDPELPPEVTGDGYIPDLVEFLNSDMYSEIFNKYKSRIKPHKLKNIIKKLYIKELEEWDGIEPYIPGVN